MSRPNTPSFYQFKSKSSPLALIWTLSLLSILGRVICSVAPRWGSDRVLKSPGWSKVVLWEKLISQVCRIKTWSIFRQQILMKNQRWYSNRLKHFKNLKVEQVGKVSSLSLQSSQKSLPLCLKNYHRASHRPLSKNCSRQLIPKKFRKTWMLWKKDSEFESQWKEKILIQNLSSSWLLQK